MQNDFVEERNKTIDLEYPLKDGMYCWCVPFPSFPLFLLLPIWNVDLMAGTPVDVLEP